MNRRKTFFQVLEALLLIGLTMWVVTTHVQHWGDWVVFGVIVLTAFGAAWGIYQLLGKTCPTVYVWASST